VTEARRRRHGASSVLETRDLHVSGLNITVGSGTISLGISSRNSRVAALQKRWDRLRAGLDLILQQRGADMADLPGGASGILGRDYKGKKADRLVTRSDPGVVSLVAELRGHERQAAEELERWKTHIEVRKVIDASPAAITLAAISDRAGGGPHPPLEPGTAANSAPGRACKRSTRRRSPIG